MTELHLYCPKGFYYHQPNSDFNRCRIYLPPRKNISKAVMLHWNRWWDLEDPPQNVYDKDLHDSALILWDPENKELLIETAESYTLDDFAETLSQAMPNIKIVVHEDEPYPLHEDKSVIIGDTVPGKRYKL